MKWYGKEAGRFNNILLIVIAIAVFLSAIVVSIYYGKKGVGKDDISSIDKIKQFYQLKIKMVKKGGVYLVPVKVNSLNEIDFIFDTGAEETTIPVDVVSTMLRQKIVKVEDFLPGKEYQLADGSKFSSNRFMIKTIEIQGYIIENVEAVITSANANPLLGQNVLSRFKSVMQDNKSGYLIIESDKPLGYEGRIDTAGGTSDSNKANEHFEKGVSYSLKKEYDKAIAEYLESLKYNPNVAAVHSNLAFAYFDKGNPDMAIQEHKKAIELDPEHANAYYGMALIYEAKDNNAEAIKNWEAFLKLTQPHSLWWNKAQERLEKLKRGK